LIEAAVHPPIGKFSLIVLQNNPVVRGSAPTGIFLRNAQILIAVKSSMSITPTSQG